MLPFGLLTVALVSAVRTSSNVRPIDASFAGSIWTRMAGFCCPPITTCATPEIFDRCCARMFSA